MDPLIPIFPIFVPTLAVTNFYHYIQYGNRLLAAITEDKEAWVAVSPYSMSIAFEPRYSTIAYYNRAYAMIIAEVEGNKALARADIEAAVTGLDVYIGEVSTVIQCVATVGQTKLFEQRKANDFGEGHIKADMNTQIQARFEILQFLREKMQEAIKKIDSISGDIIAKPVGGRRPHHFHGACQNVGTRVRVCVHD